MHHPRLLLDELLDGYIGRLVLISGCNSEIAFARVLARNRGEHARDPSAVEFLQDVCSISGASVQAILQKHTVAGALLIPAEYFLRGGAYPPGRRFAYRCWADYAKEHLWMCPQCVEDDLKAQPFAYWRRSHQLPGTFTCRAHDEPLRFIAQPRLLSFSPADALDRSRAATPEMLTDITQNHRVKVASQFIERILYPKRTPGVALRDGGELDSTEFGLLGSNEVEHTLHTAFPTHWLRWARPQGRLRCGTRDALLHGNAAKQPVGLLNLAMTASVLFPCADQAIGALGKSPALAQMAT